MIDPNVLRAVNAEKIVTSVAQSGKLYIDDTNYLQVHLSPKLMRRRTRSKHNVKQIIGYKRTTTETGTASCGIPPLIEARKETSSTDSGLVSMLLYLNICPINLENSFSRSQALSKSGEDERVKKQWVPQSI
jgi:hypothetical protein